jgi:predicted ATPase
MDVHEFEAAHDYRLEKLQGSHLYLSPADAGAKAAMDISWLRLTGRERREPATLVVKGRSIAVPQAAFGVARFSFADLCEAPLGPLDYQRIAHTYHTLMLQEIPVLGPERRNAARRLTTLIDVLYDNGVGLIASAEAEPPRALRRWRWRRRFRPHGIAAHGDAFGRLSRAAPKPSGQCLRAFGRTMSALRAGAIASNQHMGRLLARSGR